MIGASDSTWFDGWSEIVASQEALGVCEGLGAGAGRLAAQSLGDVAMAVVVAVIHRAGYVLTAFRVLQSCRKNRGQEHHTGQYREAPSPWKAAPRTGLVSFLQSPLNLHSACEPP